MSTEPRQELKLRIIYFVTYEHIALHVFLKGELIFAWQYKNLIFKEIEIKRTLMTKFCKMMFE